uniref:PB1 domain-containing protein n=1 Tax=Brassica campestris TaxID=3711 RepID=A0A3P5ZFR8_BRACM|nr:unnamed protein product [Brassica rapa]
MTTVYSASATVTEGTKVSPRRSNNNGRNGKLRVICRYGGNIVSQRYVGGDTRIVALPPAAETSFASLVSHLAATLGVSYDFKVKYQLPDQELDSLISVATDEDVQIMMEEHGYLTCEPSSASKTRIRLFLFPSKTSEGGGASQGGLARCKAVADTDWVGREESKPVLTHPKTETWFVDALKSAEMMLTGRDLSGDVNGQESMTQETSSNLGSTSSSASSSISQVKYSPVESVTSPLIAFSSSAITQISSHELPTRPHVLENKLSSNMYEAELNKPVPVQVPVSGYPPYLNQSQQQHTHVVYTGQPYITGTSPITLPATTYPHTNHLQYQLPPQPYPIYYSPVDQYSSRHVQAPPVKHNNVLNTHQVDFPMVRTSSPLATEFPLAPELYPPPKPVDSSVQTSSEAVLRDDHIYNIDHLDDDTVCAQIYKTQPPAPIIPSQLQTMMLTEALGKLRIHNG